MLVDGDVIADLCAFTDHAEAMVEEEALADLRAGMNVDASQEARKWLIMRATKNSRPSHSQWATR